MPDGEQHPVEQVIFYLNKEIFTNILRSCIRSHQFMHKNNPPTEIVIPDITEVMGVKVVYEASNRKKVK